MLISNLLNLGMAGKKMFAGLCFTAVVLASGTALAATVGDEVAFREGEPMPPAPAGMSWCLVQKAAVYDYVNEEVVVRAKANFQVPVPGEYSNRTETVEVTPAYRVGRIVPTRLEDKSISYVTQEAYETLEVIPAQFTEVWEDVEICPAYEQTVIVPAKFKNSSKRLMAAPARKNFARAICTPDDKMCWTAVETAARYIDVPTRELVEDAREERSMVPAKTKKIMVRKLAKPPEVRRTTIPATNSTYQCAVVSAETRVEWQTIPAERKEVTVEVETKAPSFTNQTIPEKKETMSRRVLVTPEQLVWRLESIGTYQPVVTCEVVDPCNVARIVPRGTPHVCSW